MLKAGVIMIEMLSKYLEKVWKEAEVSPARITQLPTSAAD
jgi:hypothetical protein